ncbi:MAG TPA: MFS transporter [Dehalococcoidia bacterium]|nr:MFS transporter [Dehalococcoidia bacterium]
MKLHGDAETDPSQALARLDDMAKSGRVTPEEAARVRAAAGGEGLEAAIKAIRARHEGEHRGAAGRTDGPAYERRWWTLGVLCLSLLIVSLDNTILNVALPTLARELDATGSELQWMVDAYVLVFAGLLLAAGALGDRFGRRRALFTGFAVFALGSVGAAVSTSTHTLIAMRAVMGLGGALIMPATLSILTNLFPPMERPKAIAFWAGTVALGVPSGPILGGWLLENFDWGAIFLVNLPILAVAAVAGSVLIAESCDEGQKPLDPAGALLSVAALGVLVFSIIEAPSSGWGSARTLVLFALAAVLLGAFVRWELRRPQPMLDMSLFRKPSFTGAALAIALVFFSLFGSLFFLTQYLQFVLGYGPLAAGVRMTPIAIGLIVGTALSTRLRPYLGTRVVIASGLVTTAAGLAVLATISDTSGYGIVLVALVIAGFGMGHASAPAIDSMMGAVPREQAGVASAVNITTRPVGGALGVAVLGSILSTAYGSAIETPTAALSPADAAAARDSIGAAVRVAARVAARIGGPEGEALLTAARSGFIDAMGTVVLVAAGVALLGAAVAATVLPSRRSEQLAPHGGGPMHGPPGRAGGSHRAGD